MSFKLANVTSKMSKHNEDYQEFGNSNGQDGIYQNAESSDPIYGNIENGAPKVHITPKFKSTATVVAVATNVEKRQKQRRNRNPRNQTVSHNPDDIYFLGSPNSPTSGYHEPSSNNRKDDSSDNNKNRKRIYILIAILLICLVVGGVVGAIFGIPKDSTGKQEIMHNPV